MSGHMATFSTASEHVPRFVDSQIQPKQNLLQLKKTEKTMFFITHTIHVWYLYVHLVDLFMLNLGKYTSPMDGMGAGR